MASSFRVRRCKPELIRPASPTPHEYKHLSVIDSQYIMRFHAQILLVYRSDPEKTVDVARLLRDGLARALVFYYPLAGRLRERSDRKLVVECTGEGALFIEGEADFSVDELGSEPHGSAPYYRELIHGVPGSGGLVGCPLLLVQVTRLKCGGFTVGVRANHTMVDASGKGQFLKAVAEMARGAAAPSVLPVWQRELLSARDPPRVTHKHPSYDIKEYEEHWGRKRGKVRALGRMISRSFVFGSPELAMLRRSLPEGLRNCSTFEVLASFLWRARVIAFDLEPEDEVRFAFGMNIRNEVNPVLPKGYYGNAVIAPCAVTTAGALRTNPLEYAIALVREAKFSVDNEFVRSATDLIAETDESQPVPVSFYIVSDLTKTAVANADLGWGKPVFVIPKAILPFKGSIGAMVYFTPVRECNGEERILVPMNMPEQAMERFASLIDDLRIVKLSRL